MSSISGMLSVARSAIEANQAAMQIAGNNIANANTDGYSRQQLVLTPGPAVKTPQGSFGMGVTMATVTRARDVLLDRDVRTQSAPAAAASTEDDLLTQVEGVFGEPTDTGIANSLDAFWNAWSDLASDPTNAGAKTVVQQAGLALTNKLNTAANDLDTIQANTTSQVVDTISQVNQLSSQIASLNAQIVPAESGGNTANGLRDQRDKLIDQLSALVPVTVIDHADGGDQVMLGGRPLVDGTTSKSLTLDPGTPIAISFAGEASPVLTMGGKLGALIKVANVDIASARSGLDQLASALVTDVNAVHTAGWSPPSGGSGNWNPALGPTGSGVPFFDPSNTNARTIQLSAQVAASANAIATSDALNATGNNNTALAMSALRDFSPSAAGNSFSGAYSDTVATVAGAASAAHDSAAVAQTVVDQAKARRDSTTGVNTDEELMDLMKFQQAYSAAAKVVQAIDDMSQVLLTLKQ